ncbi:hypothetical protein [Paenibacillus agricola]|uniref:Uncharacterized protein n=1 Tax=Paenibacillus agricola TaxID=2716264 RepID=A0ABX0J3M6_9BACL|nr:hypothetical protein [Paenibacillus agricola]NHN29428.1 hypothetical protein [Paenibacillus agricola]
MSDKKTKMKISELKSKLNQLSKQDLMKLLVESYKMSSEIQDYLGAKLSTESHVLLTILRNEDRRDDSSVVQLTVWKKWMEIPAATRDKILGNVWCARCSNAVIIRDYTISSERLGLVLKGSCAECGGQVSRVVEND